MSKHESKPTDQVEKARIYPRIYPQIYQGNCLQLIPELPESSIDIVVTSPPYWGQRQSAGTGAEPDPRDYLSFLQKVFEAIHPKLKKQGIIWINMGDSYNTPINWSKADHKYSSLGPERAGLKAENAAYTKPRHRRRAFTDPDEAWLQYGNLLMLPQRLVINLTESRFLFRGEVIWAKTNALPEGRCRRPHRKHESIYLLAKDEKHHFRTHPPVPSLWLMGNEQIQGIQHRSRFPVELPKRCIEAYGKTGKDVVVLDPFSGSGSTGMAAKALGCAYIGFEIDHTQAQASHERISGYNPNT